MSDCFSRDSLLWWAGMIGGVIIAVSGHLDLFPWLSPKVHHGIELAGFIISTVSGKLSMSPLALSPDGKMQARIDQAKAGQL